MEVYMANLPADLSQYQLQKSLREMVTALKIQDWTCQKFPRKTNGTIAFLRPFDGDVFLRQHGEIATTLFDRQGRPRMKARLVIMGTYVYCRRSYYDFDPLMLRSLQREATERRNIETSMPEAQKHPDEVFAVYALACGYLDFNRGGKLAFSPEVIWRCPSGIVKFSKDELLITYELSTITKVRVEIPYRIIESILPSTAPTTLTMTLLEPPRFYDVTKPDLATAFFGLQINQGFNALKSTRRRLAELPDGPRDYNQAKHDELIKQLEENESEIRLGLTKDLISEKARTNLTMVYKARVTPTHVSLHGPEPEAKNRILRKFETHVDRFIRFQFSDEDGQDIRFNGKFSSDAIYERFLSVLNKGVQIGGRKYDFLGFSHSSLRSQSAWFMSPFYHTERLQTYFNVINDLGEFQEIYSPARCAARIGQAFSETPFAISLKDHGISHYVTDDIRSQDRQRIFTDGVCWASQKVVDAILASLPQRKYATCFQIRWGGAKGMLALDTRQVGSAFAVRPSMVKFQSKDIQNLEICDMADKPIPLVLNRQLIKILEDMAVPNDWFFLQQNKELDRLRKITATAFNVAAFLKRKKIADQLGLPRLIRRLDILGIDYKKDRFLCSVVEAVVLRELRLLKHKARIPIDEGATLFGVVDETAFLEEGEIYITFDKTDLISTDYLTLNNCEMIVTRSPALHPGDIQLATNKIPPPGHSLGNLRNCIVFSQKGKRDLPSQLSGGDLDGDIFNVIWDQYAVSNCQRVFAPADYPLAKPRELNRQVQREDMTEFFVEFMKTNNLGVIATRHMILADQRHAGTVDADCAKLAQLHSTSVDYSKTGVPVSMETLRAVRTNRFRPDFMAPAAPTHLQNRTDIIFDAPTRPAADEYNDEEEDSGPGFRYYLSDKVLGQLYRAINEQKIWNESVRIDRKQGDANEVWNSFQSYVIEQCDDRLGGVVWDSFTDEAWDIRRAYEDAIAAACVDYSDHATIGITELEVFTGNIFNKSGIQTRRQRDRSLQIKDEFDRIAAWIESLIRKQPIADLTEQQDEEEDGLDSISNGGSTWTNDIQATALELSIACLHVGCVKEPGSRNPARPRFKTAKADGKLSFKVLAACCVLKELNIAIRQADTRAAATLGGGYLGVNGRA
ncbi:hypothetical protein KJ359_009174 [Pestalotiopsis sp. 9143b]|nr:hypothetical protein KJ359_009174 [Pestalotiopsis sp. 9143b]